MVNSPVIVAGMSALACTDRVGPRHLSLSCTTANALFPCSLRTRLLDVLVDDPLRVAVPASLPPGRPAVISLHHCVTAAALTAIQADLPANAPVFRPGGIDFRAEPATEKSTFNYHQREVKGLSVRQYRCEMRKLCETEFTHGRDCKNK